MISPDRSKQFYILAFLLSLPSIGIADIRKERMLELALTGDTSKFSTPVTILDDDPRCSGAGHVAFSVDIEANDLDFEVSGDRWNGKVWQFNRSDALTQTDTCIIGEERRGIGQSAFRWDQLPEDFCEVVQPREQVFQEDVPPKACYLTTRRGVEVSQIQVDCPEDAHGERGDSLNALVRAADIEINMSASADVCHTLTGTGLLDSEWAVTIQAGDHVIEFFGVFDPNRWFDPRSESPIRVRLVYDRRDTFLMNVTDDIASGPFQFDPMRSGNLRLSFEIDQFDLPNVDAPPLKLEGGRGFRLDIR